MSTDIDDHYNWISWWYILRFLWRILDVSSRIFICTLCWMSIGGLSLTLIISIESVAFLILVFKTKQWELLFGIVALVISFTNGMFLSYPYTQNVFVCIFVYDLIYIDTATMISWGIAIYRTISNMILMILVTIWFYVQFECPKCTDYVEREELMANNAVFGIFIYCWICTVLTPAIMCILFAMEIFEEETSLSRDLEQMIKPEIIMVLLRCNYMLSHMDIMIKRTINHY